MVLSLCFHDASAILLPSNPKKGGRMKKILWTMAFVLAWAGTSYADTISGKIKDIDTGGNALTLISDRADNAGNPSEYKVVWDDNLADAARLENAHAGETIVLDAQKNPVTQNWKAQSVGGGMASAEKSFLRTDDQTISGKVLSIDQNGRRLVIESGDRDANGKQAQYSSCGTRMTAKYASAFRRSASAILFR